MPDKFAVFAVDPGGTTGVARGVFMPQPTLIETMRLHSVESWEVTGEPESQAWEIASEFVDWLAEVNMAGVALRDVHLVFEDFQLRTQLADLSPVAVTCATRALLIPRGAALGIAGDLLSPGSGFAGGATVTLQQPGDAMRIKNARLKELRCYAIGSEHRRDAARHLVQRVNKCLMGK